MSRGALLLRTSTTGTLGQIISFMSELGLRVVFGVITLKASLSSQDML